MSNTKLNQQAKDAINKHATVPFPEGWKVENSAVLLPDGTRRKILEEVEGGGEGEKRRYRCIVPGCTYNNLFKEGSSAKFRRTAEAWHAGGFEKKKGGCTTIVTAVNAAVDSTLLTVFVPKCQMTEQTTATLLTVSPNFADLSFKYEGQLIDAREMFLLLDNYMPQDEMLDILRTLEHTPLSMHASVFKDMWNELKKTHIKLITGVKNRIVQRWTREKGDAKYEKMKVIKSMEAAITHGTIAQFDEAWETAKEMDDTLRKLDLASEADHLVEEMDRLANMLETKRKMAPAKPFYNLLIDTSKAIPWTSYLLHQMKVVHTSGIFDHFVAKHDGDVEVGDSECMRMEDLRMPIFQHAVAKHSQAEAVDGMWLVPETGEEILLTTLPHLAPVDLADLPEADPSMSKAEVHWLLTISPTQALCSKSMPKTTLSDFLRVCKATAKAYTRREEDKVRFNSAVHTSCQLMTSSSDASVTYSIFRSRFEAYCLQKVVTWNEHILSQSSLDEHCVSHLQRNGNLHVLGFQWVDPIPSPPIDYEAMSVASAKEYEIEYHAGLAEA